MTAETTRIAPGQLAALVGSRLCHDLVSPLGAIGNGVELLEMSGSAQGPEMQLISESVAAARSRIELFRMAFGQPAADQRVSRQDLAKLIAAQNDQGRLKITLDAEGDFARPEIRMVMLALMCLETAMPWGGQVTVLRQTPGWRLSGTSDRMRQDALLWGWLGAASPRRDPAPSEVQFALLAEAASDQGRLIHWECDEKGAGIAF